MQVGCSFLRILIMKEALRVRTLVGGIRMEALVKGALMGEVIVGGTLAEGTLVERALIGGAHNVVCVKHFNTTKFVTGT